MEKTEMTVQEKGKKSRKLILILALLGIGLALLAIIGLIKFGTVFFFIPFWFWTVDKIIELTGANLWLARGFAALFVLPFFYLLKLIFSWKAKRRLIGWILFSLLTASLCFTMFFLSEDIYFSFKTGQAKKWYIVTPAGEYKFSDSPGYNTLWGIQYQQVTPEIIKKYVEQERAGKATKTTGDKEIVRAIPKENTPERTVEQTIPEVEQTIPEKVIVPQQATPKEIIPEKTAKEIISFVGGDWVVTWESNSVRSGISKITIKQEPNNSSFSGTGVDFPGKGNKAFRANGTVLGNNLTMTKKYEDSGVSVVYRGSISGDRANGKWTNSLNHSGTWSMTREKEIIFKKTTPKEVASKKTAEETISKEVISTKTTGEITAKKTTGADITVSGGWSNFERIPASKEAPLQTKTTPEEESFSLSPEEEKLLVEEIKKSILPERWDHFQVKRLSDFIKLLKKSGKLHKYESLLCDIIKKDVDGNWPLSETSIEAIGHLAKVGSAKSIPTLMWAYVNVGSPDRKRIEEAMKTIKEREGID